MDNDRGRALSFVGSRCDQGNIGNRVIEVLLLALVLLALVDYDVFPQSLFLAPVESLSTIVRFQGYYRLPGERVSQGSREFRELLGVPFAGIFLIVAQGRRRRRVAFVEK